jgi:aldehyde dehydrogenase (NAD+)
MLSDNFEKFYIDGAWVAPLSHTRIGVENPATEEIVARIAGAGIADADRAVMAARAAFDAFATWPVKDRIDLMQAILDEYNRREEDFAQAMTLEMGAPIAWSREAQVWAGRVHMEATIAAAKTFAWETTRGTSRLIREGVGVCTLITPWNWPMNQIACKVAPAIVAGCTMILKPSEIAPLSGTLFAEVCHAAGVPKGVFNMVHGTGPEVGHRLTTHPEVDMVSFTGSTRAGTQIAAVAAPTAKRVTQEMGGKSPNIILPSADLAAAVKGGVEACFANSGQSCDAPTRMLVPKARHDEALAIAKAAAEATTVGDPYSGATLGPVVSRIQWDKIQNLIRAGMAEGATLVAGGPGLPEGLNRGHYVRPTVFGHVTNDMTIAREEIFGPVLSVLSYENLDEAVAIANDTPYGLAAYVQGPPAEAVPVARRIRAGQVTLNYAPWDVTVPFGGYKQSGNGREYADWGIHDFCEIKAIIGAAA